jgi:hypothetical protein
MSSLRLSLDSYASSAHHVCQTAAAASGLAALQYCNALLAAAINSQS